MSEIAVITTTVGIPKNFPEIWSNAQEHDHDIHLYIVGDNKTPNTIVKKRLRKTVPEEDFTMFTIRNQKGWLNSTFGRSKSKRYRRVFQENNYQRRTIGFLKAVQDGARTIIAVDDDNYPPTDVDYIGSHVETLGPREECMTVLPNLTYVNLIDFLVKDQSYNGRVYVRGYPLHLRGDMGYVFNEEPQDVKVNIGLWSGAPDIDAISRVAFGDVQVSAKDEMFPVAVAKGCYTSMCLQNICFDTEYLVTQYEFPMNVPITGNMTIGRYDDIWAGYICKKILDHIDKGMTFGPPITRHDRHPHDYYKDLSNEFWGMWVNMFFYSAIQQIRLSPAIDDPWSLFTEVIIKLRHAVRFGDLELMKYFNRVWHDMYMWAKMIDEMGL